MKPDRIRKTNKIGAKPWLETIHLTLIKQK